MWNLIKCSSITEQRIRQKSYEKHVQNLNKMKPKLKIAQPQQPWFIYAKKKKQLTRNQQLMDIEKSNHLLLSKIKNIQKRENQTYKKPTFLSTLNSKIMRQANTQIYKENKRICQKIMGTEAFYRTHSILQKSNNLQRVMESISVNARRVQSAKSLMMSKLKISRSSSSITRRPLSSHHLNRSKSKFDSAIKLTENNYTRPSSAPSIKKRTVVQETFARGEQIEYTQDV